MIAGRTWTPTLVHGASCPSARAASNLRLVGSPRRCRIQQRNCWWRVDDGPTVRITPRLQAARSLLSAAPSTSRTAERMRDRPPDAGPPTERGRPPSRRRSIHAQRPTAMVRPTAATRARHAGPPPTQGRRPTQGPPSDRPATARPARPAGGSLRARASAIRATATTATATTATMAMPAGGTHRRRLRRLRRPRSIVRGVGGNPCNGNNGQR